MITFLLQKPARVYRFGLAHALKSDHCGGPLATTIFHRDCSSNVPEVLFGAQCLSVRLLPQA
jgi:hypothetical protein